MASYIKTPSKTKMFLQTWYSKGRYLLVDYLSFNILKRTKNKYNSETILLLRNVIYPIKGEILDTQEGIKSSILKFDKMTDAFISQNSRRVPSTLKDTSFLLDFVLSSSYDDEDIIDYIEKNYRKLSLELFKMKLKKWMFYLDIPHQR